jgi:methionyl aminopeptidase
MERIIYKSARDLDRMREAGKVLSGVLVALRDMAAPGVSTQQLDAVAHEMIRAAGGSPSFLGYRGYPASICASLNDEVVHGIPSEERVLRDGDILKIDVGVRLRGYHADSAITVPIGSVPEETQRLLDVTRDSLWAGIRAITHRGRLADVSRAIQEYVEQNGFSVVRDMVGHGIGKSLHEPPQIANYVHPEHPNPQLLEGMTLAIEPMVNVGVPEVEVLADDWTVVTADRRMSAHFEHTVAVTRNGFDILTLGAHLPLPEGMNTARFPAKPIAA